MPKLVKITVKLPWVEGEWVADEAQQRAAWEMYIELVTRAAVQPLGQEDGLLRETLSSLYELFGETRRILRQYGPAVAMPAREGGLSFGQLAVDVLNQCVRPFLSRWHPRLELHESSRSAGRSAAEHERAWPLNEEFRQELRARQGNLVAYADLLATVSGVARLHL